jgi:type I restriction enzyme, S subunit
MNLKWDSICLGDAAKVISGFAFKSQDFLEIGIPIIKIKNIRLGTVDLSEADFVTPDFIKKLDSKYHIHSNDILISLTGSHLTQPNSVVGRVAKHSPKLGLCLLNQRAGKITITKSDLLDQKFLFYVLYTEEARRNIALMALGAASQANVSPTQVESLEIPLPPLPTQQKIAGILSAYDDLIENNTRRIEILEEMARMLYREWFVKFRFPGHEAVRFVESELGLIPEGWEVKTINDITLEIIDYRGKTPKKLGSDWSESGILAISAKNVKQGKLINLHQSKYVDEALYKKWMKSELLKGDILMTSEAPLGELYYLVNYQKLCLSQRIYSIRANPNIIHPSILYSNLSSPQTQSEIISRQSGTTVYGIRQTELRRVPLIIPTKEIQKIAAPMLENFFRKIDNLNQKNINLRKTRDLLLPRLISGEIDVENLAINTGI